MGNVDNELNSDLSDTSSIRSNYGRILKLNNDFDSSSDENVENLVVERRRNRISTVNNKISLEKKQILIKLYEEGKTIVEAAKISDINKNTAYHILRRYKNDGGVVLNKKRGGKRTFKLTDEVLSYIELIIERNPAITLKNIKSELLQKKNVNLSSTSIFNALKSLKITLKMATFTIDRFNAVSTLEQRKNYALYFCENAPQARERIIFIDEAGFNLHLRRAKARSKKNTSAYVSIPTVRGRNVSLIAAMNLHGVVYNETISNSTVNANTFKLFLDRLFDKLAEANINNAWLVVDNAKIHKTQEVRDKVGNTTHTLIYLSPYSPMLNPIEKVFSKTKLAARNLLSESENDLNLVDIIKQSLSTVTSSDCNNYYVDMTMKLPIAAAGQPLH